MRQHYVCGRDPSGRLTLSSRAKRRVSPPLKEPYPQKTLKDAMLKELLQLTFDKIMQTRSYTVIVLGTPEKRFAIYTEPNIGKTIQMYLTGVETQRPLTHELMNGIFKGFNIRVKQVIIIDVEDTVYFSRLYLELEQDEIRQIVEIDARPSDCILLALMNNVPIFCTREMLNKTIAVED